MSVRNVLGLRRSISGWSPICDLFVRAQLQIIPLLRLSQHQELRNNERLLGVESSSLLGSGPETVKEGAEVAKDLLAFQGMS